ncbi:Protein of unknown function DUF284,transmembrane eukaryotic family-containing protein [Aphelenchoides fujianensis]|nr:Protein of unknown function DUF284,transmembrane eukaryotic family-containing protein [Aphelenchoides fujianensis]
MRRREPPKPPTPPPSNFKTPSKWRQQEIRACRPIYTPCCVISTVFFIGVLFIPLGFVMLFAADSIKEWSREYTNCGPVGSVCRVEVHLEQDFLGDVYFYYELRNFHQNARRYARNWNPKQLTGDLGCTTSCSDPYKNVRLNVSQAECRSRQRPSDKCRDTFWEDGACRRAIAPCGAIANSMFNDTFELLDPNGRPVPLTYEGLLPTSAPIRFNNPRLLPSERNLCDVFNSRTARPPSWTKSPCELDPSNPENNGFQNFDFMVWMNVAALPNFRKPYRRLQRTAGGFQRGLPAGRYTLVVHNNYNVSSFDGKKRFVITTTSWLGGRNRFFGIAYLTVGCACVLLGIALVVIHWLFGNTLEEIAQLPGEHKDDHARRR